MNCLLIDIDIYRLVYKKYINYKLTRQTSYLKNFIFKLI